MLEYEASRLCEELASSYTKAVAIAITHVEDLRRSTTNELDRIDELILKTFGRTKLASLKRVADTKAQRQTRCLARSVQQSMDEAQSALGSISLWAEEPDAPAKTRSSTTSKQQKTACDGPSSKDMFATCVHILRKAPTAKSKARKDLVDQWYASLQRWCHFWRMCLFPPHLC
mgnify:CR=1 FL=1